MEITYLGHSSFRLKGKEGIVVTDPFGTAGKMKMPTVKADVVTVSHHHPDHDNVLAVKSNAVSGVQPFVIDQAGEYEVKGITVFGYPTWHDDQEGAQRGRNIAYSIFLDNVHVLHLGDLGHILPDKQVEEMPDIDILLCPVGGVYTIDPQQAVDAISKLEPAYVIPMHYKTESHDAAEFGELATLDEFLQKYGKTAVPQDKLVITAKSSEEETETQLVVLEVKTA